MTDPRAMIVNDHWPYLVAEHLMDAYQYRMLRLHGRYVANGPQGVTPEEMQELAGFYETLRDQVIVFDPRAGWSYRTREIWDEDLLIGVNEHTRLTDEGSRIWQFPPNLR